MNRSVGNREDVLLPENVRCWVCHGPTYIDVDILTVQTIA